MIFVTVGTQLAFPRLIDAMQDHAARIDEPVIAQTGEAAAGRWPDLDVRPTLAPQSFAETFASARVVVSHAGIGTILSAARFGRPLVMLPRRVALGEHRNDHQMATAHQLEGRPGIHVAWEVEALEGFLLDPDLCAMEQGVSPERSLFLERLRALIAP